MEQIRGIIPPIITPFKDNGDVDYAGFEANVLKWNEDRLAGYFVNGSNSEMALMNETEMINLVKITADTAAEGRLVMAGTGRESARETISFTRQCAQAGAQYAFVLTPSFFVGAMDSAGMVRYYTEVADHSDIPVFLYNASKFTGVTIEVDAVAELSRHPNIVGIKDSNGDVPKLASYIRTCAPEFQIMTGTFGAWYPALALGLTAAVTALGNCCPNEASEVQTLTEKGEWAAAQALYQRMFPVNAAVTGPYGVPGLKYVCERLGYTGGYVRNPLAELDEAAKTAIDKVLQTASLI